MRFLYIVVAFILIFSVITATAQNRVLKLDGDGDYVQFPSNIFNDFDEATIEAWVKWERFGYYSQPFGFGSADKMQIMVVNNELFWRHLQFYIYHSYRKLRLIQVKNFLLLNQWLHIAAVSGKNGMKLYVNGGLVGENDYTGSFSAIQNNDLNYLGKSQWSMNHDFKGQLDEVRVWQIARTQKQIQDSMFKRLIGNENGLVSLLSFEEGDARDSSENGYDGIMYGDARCVYKDFPSPSNVVPGLSGKVTDEVGNPLANAEIRLAQNREIIRDTITDDAGNYGILIHPPGEYDLCASWHDKGDWRLQMHFSPGEQRFLNLTLKQAISISGTILTWDNTPHVNVTVQVVEPNKSTETPQVIATTLSDEGG